MKFCQLVEYNMRRIFLEKQCIKCGEKLVPRPFAKKAKFSISLDQQSEVLCSLFLLYVQVDCYRNVLKLGCRPLAFVQETKRNLKLISLPYFLHDS